MANFTAADVKKLRELTAAGMMDCKNALQEADGDFDRAVEILRVKGLRGVTKREGRAASNGLVAAQLEGTSSGVLLELDCETDFVAKGERFQQLAATLVRHVAEHAPADVSSLLDSAVDGGRTIRDVVDEGAATLGEKIEVRRFARFADGTVTGYLHRTSPDLPPQVGVLLETTTSGDTAATAEVAPQVTREVAQHIAAFAPRFVSRDEVPADVVDNERRLAEATAIEEGKPQRALPKIVEGRVNGFLKDTVLLEQPFAKDSKKTVQQVLAEGGLTVTRFARFRVGTE